MKGVNHHQLGGNFRIRLENYIKVKKTSPPIVSLVILEVVLRAVVKDPLVMRWMVENVASLTTTGEEEIMEPMWDPDMEVVQMGSLVELLSFWRPAGGDLGRNDKVYGGITGQYVKTKQRWWKLRRKLSMVATMRGGEDKTKQIFQTFPLHYIRASVTLRKK